MDQLSYDNWIKIKEIYEKTGHTEDPLYINAFKALAGEPQIPLSPDIKPHPDEQR